MNGSGADPWDAWKLIERYDVLVYACGLKGGDKVRLKTPLDIREVGTGRIVACHPAGEVWTVLPGSSQDVGTVWLLQPDGERHTWTDAVEIFDVFEKI